MSKNRDRIIQSALSLFSEKNFEDVTIKDICQKAEVANSTFYYHFKTKEELMDCLRMHDMRPRNRELFAWVKNRYPTEAIAASNIRLIKTTRILFFAFFLLFFIC